MPRRKAASVMPVALATVPPGTKMVMDDDLGLSRVALDDMKNDEFSCCICLSVLTQPVVTKCLHRFCRECLSRHVRNYEKKATSRCPLCNMEIHSLRSTKNDYRWGELINLLATGHLHPISDDQLVQAETVGSGRRRDRTNNNNCFDVKNDNQATDMDRATLRKLKRLNRERVLQLKKQAQEQRKSGDQQRSDFVRRRRIERATEENKSDKPDGVTEEESCIKYEQELSEIIDTEAPTDVYYDDDIFDDFNSSSLTDQYDYGPTTVTDILGVDHYNMTHPMSEKAKHKSPSSAIDDIDYILNDVDFFTGRYRDHHLLIIHPIKLRISIHPKESGMSPIPVAEQCIEMPPDSRISDLKRVVARRYFVDDREWCRITLQVPYPVAGERSMLISGYRVSQVMSDNMTILQMLSWFRDQCDAVNIKDLDLVVFYSLQSPSACIEADITTKMTKKQEEYEVEKQENRWQALADKVEQPL